jgi:hypothetical protein
MVENLANHFGVGDESNDPKFPSARAEERVSFENSLYRICPSFPESGSLLGVWDRLIGLGGGGPRSGEFELEAMLLVKRRAQEE